MTTIFDLLPGKKFEMLEKEKEFAQERIDSEEFGEGTGRSTTSIEVEEEHVHVKETDKRKEEKRGKEIQKRKSKMERKAPTKVGLLIRVMLTNKNINY